MKESARTIWQGIGIFALALLWVFGSTMVAGGIITGLPRPSPGESPAGSKVLCLGIVVLVQFALPCVVVALSLKSQRLRIIGFLSTMCAMLITHRLLEGLDMLDKAWRRGL